MTASILRLARLGCLVLLAPSVTGADKRFRQGKGRFLTNEELAQIRSIDTLQAQMALRSRHAAHSSNSTNSTNATGTNASSAVSSGAKKSYSAVTFPNYQDSACNSNGEFFCDPTNYFSAADRANMTTALMSLRGTNPVMCGRLMHDKIDLLHLEPFFLGVAVVTDWPAVESDSTSLEHFGQVVEANWNMDQSFVGYPIPYAKCPNTGVLIFAPDTGMVYLSTGSCEFICEAASNVSSVVRTVHREEGPAQAVLAGMQSLYYFLGNRTANIQAEMAASKTTLKPVLAAAPQGPAEPSSAVQRVIFGGALTMFFAGLLVAFFVLFVGASSVLKKHST